MMYSFAQRPDTIVVDEPLYAHYLRVTGADHPGHKEVLASQCSDGEKVVQDIISSEYPKEVAFFKQMTHHLVGCLNEDFMHHTKNIIFVRNPEQIICSYAVVVPNVTLDDIGVEKQWELFNRLSETCNPDNRPIVLDSNEILKDPPKVLKMLCAAIEIPFYEEMLKWEAGARPEDGCWAKYWYKNVHNSTGFIKQTKEERVCPDYLKPLLEKCKPYYEKLYANSLKA
ncbi:branched-chain-amino-acid aminotransferase-like protein 1 [Ditylenchus destructor]|uniref:Branched-chain-amino-acid aminotransferase-like protein 1 n=1 Tax=Ditylenchus destructor TaxID=166010 RepID=A0AAD4NI76_9BILA|nr:branched-chain-amino-acid aminotransferase-like protein 1 [Ditylenchus destructor]